MSEKHPCCQSHCCLRHGCKYSHDDCPVVLGEEIQEFPCEECEVDEMESLHVRGPQGTVPSMSDGKITLDRAEHLKIVQDNVRKAGQITELQQELTLKEELLRAHRRVKLTDDQRAALEKDLRDTADEVKTRYGK